MATEASSHMCNTVELWINHFSWGGDSLLIKLAQEESNRWARVITFLWVSNTVCIIPLIRVSACCLFFIFGYMDLIVYWYSSGNFSSFSCQIRGVKFQLLIKIYYRITIWRIMYGRGIQFSTPFCALNKKRRHILCGFTSWLV